MTNRFLPVAALLLAASALGAQQTTPTTEIARILVKPASRTMTAGDTLRLTAEAYDAQGRLIPGVTFRYRLGPAARFEGRVDSLGLVTSGSTATLPITVTATLASARPKFESIEIKALPGPAVRVDVAPATAKLVVGQRIRLRGRAYSAGNDVRADRMSWRSSNAKIATVNEAGLVTAVGAGRATIVSATGKIEGNVIASKKIKILGSGILIGNVRTPAISIEAGAYFHGQSDMEGDS